MSASALASDLHCWLYVSECRLPERWQEAAVADIVAVSRLRNTALDVTGALLFTGNRFAQFIEGPKAGLMTVRASIERDARHSTIRTVLAGPVEARRFGQWSLAYTGPSLFVSARVDAALDDARSADELIDTLEEFSTQP